MVHGRLRVVPRLLKGRLVRNLLGLCRAECKMQGHEGIAYVRWPWLFDQRAVADVPCEPYSSTHSLCGAYSHLESTPSPFRLINSKPKHQPIKITHPSPLLA